MLYAIWRWIQLWILPMGWVLKIYSNNKALPANIRTASGRNYKAVLITTEYGLLFSEDKYIENRTQKLREKEYALAIANKQFMDELNSLSNSEKQKYYDFGPIQPMSPKKADNQKEQDTNGTL